MIDIPTLRWVLEKSQDQSIAAGMRDHWALMFLKAATEQVPDLLDELERLRAVADAAGQFIHERGTVQERTPLHDALAAYYLSLAEQRRIREGTP